MQKMANQPKVMIDPRTIEVINDQLGVILDEAVFDERTEKIFRMRYGIEHPIETIKVISKELKMPMKKLNLEIVKIDNKVFNILKKHDLFE